MYHWNSCPFRFLVHPCEQITMHKHRGAVRAALRDERVEAERRNSAVTEAIGAGLLDQCVHVASLAPCGRCVTPASILGAVLAGVVQLPADISVAALMSERGDANVREFINAHRRLAADIV